MARIGLILQKVCGQGLSCDKKEDLGHRFRWHKVFKITILLDSSNYERIKKIAPKRINQICWNNGYLAIFLLVSSRQNFLSFSFPHFLCIFSEDDATFGKDISRPNHSFFLILFKKILRKQKWLARILLHEKRRKRGKYAEK